MSDMDAAPFDLWFDPSSVAGDLVAECWISHGPRADDADFDPIPGDWLTVGDGDEAPLKAEVINRDGDRVKVQIRLGSTSAAVA